MDTLEFLPQLFNTITGPSGGIFALGALSGAGLMYFFVSRHQLRALGGALEARFDAAQELHDREVANLKAEIERLRRRFEPLEKMMVGALEAKISDD